MSFVMKIIVVKTFFCYLVKHFYMISKKFLSIPTFHCLIYNTMRIMLIMTVWHYNNDHHNHDDHSMHDKHDKHDADSHCC